MNTHMAGNTQSRLKAFKALCVFALVLLISTGVPALQSVGMRSDPLRDAETVAIDAQAPGHPFPHFWEQMFGSGRAILTLRDAYRRDLRMVKKVSNLQYIRCHAIFHDEIGLYSETPDGNPNYNFTYIDQIYDGFLDSGVKPFVELSFMPRQLANAPIEHPFWYHPVVSQPRDWSRWQELILRFAQHLVDRYGIDEVSQWYFEVWNEPNIDFWGGQPKESTYYELYDRAAVALKQVHSRLRVGGPATAQAAWVDRFIEHCASRGIPVDFVSTHAYANDSAKDIFGTDEIIARSDMLGRAVQKVYDQVKKSARPELPIFWSEFNASYKNEVEVTDSPFMGPWLANTIRQCNGMVSAMSYWTISDVFEEQGIPKSPFYGGFGLIATGGIPKASFNAFKLLHRLGTERVPNSSSSVIVTRRRGGTLAVAIWNYAPPGEAGAIKAFRLNFTHLGNRRKARITMLDRDHGSSLTAWETMGRPQFPSRVQQKTLCKAAELPAAEERLLNLKAGKASTILILPGQCLALVEIVK